MLYKYEEAFIDKFLACLKKLNVNAIPFDNDYFYSGIEEMQNYFQSHRANFGKASNEISMLFIKNPTERNYSRFRDAISEQNGWYMAFENPGYFKGYIKISDTDADNILLGHDVDIPNEYLFEFARAFCNGANIIQND